MNKKRWIKLGAAIILIVLLGFAGYKYWQYRQTQNTTVNQDVYIVKTMDLKAKVSATGTIKPVESVEVSSKITARIKEILVKENQMVKAGETIALLIVFNDLVFL